MGIAAGIDKAIAVIAPQAALKRTVARQKMQILDSGYGNYGASVTKKSLAGWLHAGGSSREDIEDNVSVLRQRTRDLYMGVPLANGAVKTMRTNIVGRGLRLKSTIDAETLGISPEERRNLEKKIEKEWSIWAESNDCDMSRIDNFYELQQLAFMNWLISGDCLAVLPVKPRIKQPYDLRVQLIEADRLCSPDNCDTMDNKIVGGVEVDKSGEVIAYHIANHHPLSYAYNDISWQRVEAYGQKTGRRNVLHMMNRERIGQRRGVPFLAPVIESLKQLGRYTDAELVAAVVSGMFTIFIEKADASAEDAIGSMLPEEVQVDAEDESTIELAPGAVIDLNEGEKAHDTNPGRPNANFGGFVEAICQQIGAALEIPYELLVKRFNSSYTASKGPGFFTDPAIRKAYCGAKWNGPAKGMLDPIKEVTAAEKRVSNGFSTRSDEAMQMTGSNFYNNVEQLKHEEKELKEVKKIANGTTNKQNTPAEPADNTGNEPTAGQQNAGQSLRGDDK